MKKVNTRTEHDDMITCTDVMFWDIDIIVANPFINTATRKVRHVINTSQFMIIRYTL